jgi:hypothetical protein
MVPLREWSKPTLIGSPVGAVPVVGSVAGSVVGSLAPPQALSNRLVPKVADPYSKNLRLPKGLVIRENYYLVRILNMLVDWWGGVGEAETVFLKSSYPQFVVQQGEMIPGKSLETNKTSYYE